MPALPPRPVPTDLESLLQRLLGDVQAPNPVPPVKSGITNLTLLQGLFLGIPAPRTRPGPIRWDWATIVCFSCDKAGHGVGWCPELNETFSFMLPGWSAEKVGSSYALISPRYADFAGEVAAGVASPAVLAGAVAVEVASSAIAGEVAVLKASPAVARVASLADFARIAPGIEPGASLADAVVAFLVDFAGVIAVGVASLDDAGAASLADAGVASPADLTCHHMHDIPDRCWGGVPGRCWGCHRRSGIPR